MMLCYLYMLKYKRMYYYQLCSHVYSYIQVLSCIYINVNVQPKYLPPAPKGAWGPEQHWGEALHPEPTAWKWDPGPPLWCGPSPSLEIHTCPAGCSQTGDSEERIWHNTLRNWGTVILSAPKIRLTVEWLFLVVSDIEHLSVTNYGRKVACCSSSVSWAKRLNIKTRKTMNVPKYRGGHN